MKKNIFVLSVLCSIGSIFAESGTSSSKMFTISPEEMVFASKLSDVNRRRFCYTFSVKERTLAMQHGDASLSPDQKVEQVFSSLCAQLQPDSQSR